ncbi:MAG: hypothetical protein AB8G11_04905 [Saprospiraceae bacterium]
MKILNTLTLLLLIGLTIAACKDETPTNQEESAVDLTVLQGIWTIDTVKLGDKVRNSLNGGTFNFVNDTEFISGVNLQGTGIEIDKPTTYELDGESIKIMGTEALVFDIQRLDTEKMVLNARIRGLECLFSFSRQEELN